ncbi:MAG: YraN family protein [Verrucomicrobia bacterium]|nr:MAG: YraN family protein [Verrucomicrobiota bacterium]
MNSALARSIADLSNRWRNRFSRWRRSPKSGHLGRGARGERLACRYLKRNGYKVLVRNFRGRSGGEIDIVCRNNDTLVFVEVKTRARQDFGRPVEAVDREKQKRISRGALAWLRMLDNPDILFRFDVVEVIIADNAKPRMELIKNAFPLSRPYLY